MKNKTTTVLISLITFCLGIMLTTFIKKEKVIFVHKNECKDGKCVSYKDAYLIEEGLDDINYYVERIEESIPIELPWLDYIKGRTEEIKETIK